jgi:YHS domain-containing protein
MKLLAQRIFLAFIFILSIFGSGIATAKEDPIYTSFFSSQAAGGYDVTAYFSESKPVKGDKKFQTSYMGADWLFSNAENLEKFKASPQSYAPQYGGYCAWAVSNRELYKGDPEYWTIHNGKLYLNYDSDVQQRWLKDKDGFIVGANRNWPSVLD